MAPEVAPAELFDRLSPHWASVRALRAWLAAHDLPGAPRAGADAGPAACRAAAIEAWLRANGCAHEGWPKAQLDWNKVSATGIKFGPWRSEQIRERIAAIDDDKG